MEIRARDFDQSRTSAESNAMGKTPNRVQLILAIVIAGLGLVQISPQVMHSANAAALASGSNKKNPCVAIDDSYKGITVAVNEGPDAMEVGQVFSANDGTLAVLTVISDIDDDGDTQGIDFVASLKISALIIKASGGDKTVTFDPPVRSASDVSADDRSAIDRVIYCYATRLPVPTETAVASPVASEPATATTAPTLTPTTAATETPTVAPSSTETETPMAVPTSTATATDVATASATATETSIPTATPDLDATRTVQASETAAAIAATNAADQTATASVEQTKTASAGATATAEKNSADATLTASASAAQATEAAEQTQAAATPEPINTIASSATATESPTETVAPSPTTAPTDTPEPTRTEEPTVAPPPTETVAVTESPAATETASEVPTVTPIYEVPATEGFDAWTVPAGWSVVDGVLTSDGTDFQGYAQPNRSIELTNYAVEVELRVVEQPTDCGGNIGVVTRGNDSGFYAGGVEWVCGQGSTVKLWAYDRVLAEQPIELNGDWITLRIETSGDVVRLSVNGNLVAEVTDTSFPTGDQIALWSNRIKLEVRAVRVIPLG